MLKEFIKGYIIDLLKEETKYKKETGIDLPRWKEKLAKYEKSGGYFVHFTDYESPWVYPDNKFDTPTGFYCYPLNFKKIGDFATGQRYIIICKPKSSARILQLRTYSEDQYKEDLEKIKNIDEKRFDDLVTSGKLNSWEKKADIQTPGGIFWNVTRMYANEKVGRWAMLLFRALGYDGVEDNRGIIHASELHQVVFFNTTKLDIIDILDKDKTSNLQIFTRKDFFGQDLRGKDLRGQGLRGAIFSKANLQGIDLSGVNLSGASFQKTNLQGANLRLANLQGANLRSANLTKVNFVGINLIGADLTKADLTKADLIYANLRSANLRLANLSGANLRLARLQGANLQGANLQGITLSQAYYSDTTIFPPGFDLSELTKV